ncbi:uncharacterized protein LOC121386047 [Gigantopelta aegis]|uniref:uncharacterized protein LOC121386047 n=1 Tax=Gigantopelta aegis TaxID=1735272 RepID=UPI001B88DACF|nr:uncharacterized protein LOC121386047 [Gigantopelta aegis]
MFRHGVCSLIVLLAIPTSECATPSKNTRSDDATMQLFLTNLFGEMWGYYLSGIFTAPGPVVLHAKEPCKFGPRLPVQCPARHVETRQTHETTKSSEEISFTKLISMILCFGMFGLMVSLPELVGIHKKELCDSDTDIPEICKHVENSPKKRSNDTLLSALICPNGVPSNCPNSVPVCSSENQLGIPELEYIKSDSVLCNGNTAIYEILLQNDSGQTLVNHSGSSDVPQKTTPKKPNNRTFYVIEWTANTKDRPRKKCVFKVDVSNKFLRLGKRQLRNHRSELFCIVQPKLIRME